MTAFHPVPVITLQTPSAKERRDRGRYRTDRFWNGIGESRLSESKAIPFVSIYPSGSDSTGRDRPQAGITY